MSAFGGKADITRWAEQRGSAQMCDRASLCPLVKGCKGKTVPALLLAASNNKGGTVKRLPTRRSFRSTGDVTKFASLAGSDHFQRVNFTRYNALS
jgi:hypothetical protein